jgi:hypothetical protein
MEDEGTVVIVPMQDWRSQASSAMEATALLGVEVTAICIIKLSIIDDR